MAIYPLPYLEPAVDGRALASSAEAGAPAVSDRLRHEDVARLALDRIRLDLRERIRCGIDVLAGDKGSRVVVEALEMV